MRKRPACKLPRHIVYILHSGATITGKHAGITFRVRNGKQQFYVTVNKVDNKEAEKNG